MNHKVLLILFSICLLHHGVKGAASCGDFCKFRFCRRSDTEFVVRREGGSRSLLPHGFASRVAPCKEMKNGRFLGMVNLEFGEPEISANTRGKGTGYMKASSFSPSGIMNPYPALLFTNFTPFPEVPGGRLQLAPIASNEYKLLGNRCIRVPIVKHQLSKLNYKILPKVFMRNKPRKTECVEFRAQTPQLVISFQWFTGDDFDLTVVEPNGMSAINRFNPKSSVTGGALINDVGDPDCMRKSSREAVQYLSGDTPESGSYQIFVRRFAGGTRCSDEVPWRMSVIQDGVVLKDVHGMVSPMNPTVPDMTVMVTV